MIKIIKDGQKKFVVKCHTCGCEFSYEINDVVLGSVVCPCCGNYVAHILESSNFITPGIFQSNWTIGSDGVTTADWSAPNITAIASNPKKTVTETTNLITKDYSEEEAGI